MSFLRNVLAAAAGAAPTAAIGTGVGTLLSDKDAIEDKLKTGLVTGAGAAAGTALVPAYDSIVDKIMKPGEAKADTVWKRLQDKRDGWGESFYDVLGKNRAQYEQQAPYMRMTTDELMEKARVAAVRRKAAEKAQSILDKVRTRHNKLGKASIPLGLLALASGGYAGYKYMED
jgi:hypothetical protein